MMPTSPQQGGNNNMVPQGKVPPPAYALGHTSSQRAIVEKDLEAEEVGAEHPDTEPLIKPTTPIPKPRTVTADEVLSTEPSTDTAHLAAGLHDNDIPEIGTSSGGEPAGAPAAGSVPAERSSSDLPTLDTDEAPEAPAPSAERPPSAAKAVTFEEEEPLGTSVIDIDFPPAGPDAPAGVVPLPALPEALSAKAAPAPAPAPAAAAAAAAAAGRAAGKSTTRQIRFATLCGFLALCFLVWLAVAGLSRVVLEYEFDHADPTYLLPIGVAGCDVIVQASATGRAKVKLDYKVLTQQIRHQVAYLAGSSNLKWVEVNNVGGCDTPYDHKCSSVCKVVVSVPADGSTNGVWVYQLQDDATPDVMVTVDRGVKMDQIRVLGAGGRSPAGKTLGLLIRETADIEVVAAFTDAGPIISYSHRHVSVDLWSKQNNVMLLSAELADHDVNVRYRQPENRVCLAAGGSQGLVIAPDPDPWALCDLSYTSNFHYRMTLKQYDLNNDFFVEQAEFTEGLAKMGYCCGSLCPFLSRCRGLASQIFANDIYSVSDAEDNDESGRSGVLTDLFFAQGVIALNNTGVVPRCMRQADILVPGATNSYEFSGTFSSSVPRYAGIIPRAAAVPYRWQLVAERGMVSVTSWRGDLCDELLDGLNETVVTYSAGGIPGLKMLAMDAQRLIKDIQNKYEKVTADDDVYVVIDTIPAPGMSGIPRTRWIYSSREMYLTLEPAHLQVMTGGVMTPAMKYYKVRWTNNDCDDIVDNPTTAQCIQYRHKMDEAQLNTLDSVNEQIAGAMYEQILTALKPLTATSLKGHLVMVNHTHRPAPQRTRLVAFDLDPSGGDVRWLEFKSRFQFFQDVAAYLSIGIAIVVASMAVYTMQAYGTFLLERRAKVVKLQKRQMKMKLAEDGIIEEEDKDEAGEAAVKLTPLQTPFRVLTALFVQPVRRSTVDSLDKFITERCELSKPKSRPMLVRLLSKAAGQVQPAAPRAEAHVFLRPFSREYNDFCFNEDLNAIDDVNTLHRTLIAKYKLSIRPVPVTQVWGMQWAAGVPHWSNAQMLHHRQGIDSPDRAIMSDAQQRRLIESVFEHYVAFTGKMVAHRLEVLPRPFDHLDANASIGLDAVKRTQLETVDVLSVMLAHLDELNARDGGAEFGDRTVDRKTLKMVLVREVAEKFGGKYHHRKGKQVRGLTFKNFEAGGKVKRTKMFYLIEMYTVVLHTIFIFLLPVASTVFAFKAQDVYARSTAMESPFLFALEVMKLWPRVDWDPNIFWPSLFVLRLNAVYCVVALLRMAYQYSQLLDPASFLAAAVRNTFGVLFAVYLVMVIAYFCMFGVWCVLAAVLSPTDYLPIGMGAVVVVAVVVVVYKSMQQAAARLRSAVQQAIDLQATATISSLNGGSGDGDVLGAAAGGGGGLEGAGEGDSDMTAQLIFNFLDEDDSGTLDTEQFKALFSKLDLKLDPDLVDRMFAYCDVDCSGQISMEEFQEGWKYIQDEVTQKTVEQLGVGTGTMIVVCTSLFLVLTGLVVFVYLGLVMWDTESNFTAIMSSLLITGAGGLSTKVRTQSKAESENMDPNALVAGVLDQGTEGKEE